MTGLLIIIGALIIISKALVKGLEDLEIRRWEQTIQATALLLQFKTIS